ncbi:FMN-dependent NADH-azoreductase [Erythrobacter insulae]|uniref:FMN dependent NADH:quinone oxidoreductase n=1 Tax=Erythrobacter insulae TaxID=2584124 RepID=A0A547PDR3_9SPHN|nr:NAD(P)H-dependent oxidoreductase [Erythrobacter insulae]TRD12281.1 FMN-dependent NADH-azoreductase [Erythrobacter insulae]
MSNILHLSASIRGDESVSDGLGKKLAEGLAAKSGASITARNLAANDLPFISEDRFGANLTPAADRTPEQAELAAIADTLIEELMAADTVVFATPIYNFSVPATVKAWADLVARAGTTFEYTPTGPAGLLEGKKAYITVASGGTPVGSDMDFATSWLKFFLGFLGIKDVQVIAADGIMGEDAADKIAAAHSKVDAIIA